jgi:segregation and condensation protein A
LIKYAKGWNNLLSFLPPNLKTSLDRRSALASHFTASLEMVRDGQARLRQDNHFGPIYLVATEQKS